LRRADGLGHRDHLARGAIHACKPTLAMNASIWAWADSAAALIVAVAALNEAARELARG
jgi:hypothetical protein